MIRWFLNTVWQNWLECHDFSVEASLIFLKKSKLFANHKKSHKIQSIHFQNFRVICTRSFEKWRSIKYLKLICLSVFIFKSYCFWNNNDKTLKASRKMTWKPQVFMLMECVYFKKLMEMELGNHPSIDWRAWKHAVVRTGWYKSGVTQSMVTVTGDT